MPLHELEVACQRETRRFRAGQSSNTRFCLEVFRRALALNAATLTAPTYNDEDARATLVRIYTDFIKANINRSAVAHMVTDDLTQQVWLRFWRAANNGLSFPTLEAALDYLKLTTVTAVIEERRRNRRSTRNESLQQIIETSGEEALTDRSANLFDQHAQARFRARCRELLTEALEDRIFWMRYGMGMPPRDIARVLEREGVRIKERVPTARIVSDLLDRSCKRLALDPEIRDLLGGE